MTASYTDREGPNKSAQATSDYPVQRAPGQNAAPTFPDQDPDTVGVQNTAAARSIAENTPKGMAIGSPVEAEDLNAGSRLTYTLGGDGADHFDIDRKTGQLMTRGDLDADAVNGDEYTVTVRATDPSGDPHVETAVPANSATITVTITVEDLAEDPQIVVPDTDNNLDGFDENTAIGTLVVTFTADVEPDDGAVSRWSLAGPDGSKFTITGGALAFKTSPDYEMPGDADGDNMYEVTVRATDSDSRTGTKDVTVRGRQRRRDRHRDPVADPAPGRSGDHGHARRRRRRHLRQGVAVVRRCLQPE